MRAAFWRLSNFLKNFAFWVRVFSIFCAPTSHLAIVSPDYFMEHPVDAILIVAPGYTAEIAGIIRKRFGSEVEILALKSNHLEKLEES